MHSAEADERTEPARNADPDIGNRCQPTCGSYDRRGGAACGSCRLERPLDPDPRNGAGKSSLTAWFVDRGFAYLTDELAVLTADGAVAGLPRALMLKRDTDTLVSALPRFACSPSHRAGEDPHVRAEADARSGST